MLILWKCYCILWVKFLIKMYSFECWYFKMRQYTLSLIMNQNALVWLRGGMTYVHLWLFFFSNKHAPPGGLHACGPLQQWGCASQWRGSSPEVSSAGRPPAHTVSFKSKHSVLIHAGVPLHYLLSLPEKAIFGLLFWSNRGNVNQNHFHRLPEGCAAEPSTD